MRGSIHKRGGTYSVVYRVTDPATGKTKQVWRSGFKTKKAAEDELKEIVRTIDRGTYVPPTKQTFGEYLEADWLPSLENQVAGGKLKPTTAAFYRNLTKSHVIPRLGGVPLKALDAPALNACYRDLLSSGAVKKEGGLSPTTVHAVHVAISKALGDAVRWGKLARNVASLADSPRPASSKSEIWSSEQLRQFLDSVKDDRLYALWLLAVTSGMRRGELSGLRWEDLDLDNGRLTISQTRVSVGYDVVTTTPKSASSHRSFALDPTTVKALKSWQTQQGRERLAWGPGWADTGLVFSKEDGTPYHPQRITQAFARKAKSAGLPAIRLHDVRHSYGTACLEAGVPLKVVSERLGHSSITITGGSLHTRKAPGRPGRGRPSGVVHPGRCGVSGPAWEQKLRRAAKKQGLTLQKAIPCGALWRLRDADGKLLQGRCLHPTEVAERLGVELTGWVFPGGPC